MKSRMMLNVVYVLTTFSLCLPFTSAYAADSAPGKFEKIQIMEPEKIAQSDTGSSDNMNTPGAGADQSAAPGTMNAPSSDQSMSQSRLSPKDALQRLLDGNKRFMKDQIECPEQNLHRRAATIEQQRPFAIVLGCSDSRTPPEKVFNQGIGDVFVVRIAGNVVAELETESVEFAANTFGSSIIIVLGHQNCGAVDAAMKGQTQGVPELGKLIKPALAKLKGKNPTLEEATIANVKNSVQALKKAAGVAPLIKAGKIGIVGAYYDFTSGEVRIVQDLDQQSGA